MHGAEFDYNTVLAQESSLGGAAAAVIALDNNCNFVASVVRSGRFIGQGALNASAKELAKKVAILVTMTFTDDGRLIYVIHQKHTDQIMNLVFRVVGNQLVTNQVSHPHEETTVFSFDEDSNLILDYGGSTALFARH